MHKYRSAINQFVIHVALIKVCRAEKIIEKVLSSWLNDYKNRFYGNDETN
jgi:hypothetical protein